MTIGAENTGRAQKVWLRANGANSYIHYSAENADLSSVYQKISMSKQKILKNFGIKKLHKRTANLMKQLTPEQQNEVEMLLSGETFKGYSESGIVAGNLPYQLKDYSLEEAIGKAGEGVNESLARIADFCDKVNSTVMEYLNSKTLMDQYTNYLVQQFTNNKFSVAKGPVANQILEALLSKSGDGFFRMAMNGSEAEGIGTSITKLLALAYALPQSTLASSTVKYSNSGKGAINAQGSRLAKEIVKKYNGWVQELNAIAAEQAVAIATLDANEKILEQLDGTVIHSGGQNFSVEYIPDPQIKTYLNEVKGALKRATGVKRSKADVYVSLGRNSVDAHVGLTVKETKTDIRDPNVQSFDIQLQNSTPLLTLLVREGGMTGNDMIDIYNLVSVHGDSSELNSMWNELVDYLKYKSLLNVLAGINIPEQSYFIVINGNFWTMEDFLNHIMTSNSTVSWSAHMADGGSSGLKRATYVRHNVWRSPTWRNPYSALKRANAQQSAASNIMYSTKITVNLRLSELAALVNLAK